MLAMTAREKLNKEFFRKVVPDPKGSTLLIPKPIDIEELMRKISKGKMIITEQIREH